MKKKRTDTDYLYTLPAIRNSGGRSRLVVPDRRINVSESARAEDVPTGGMVRAEHFPAEAQQEMQQVRLAGVRMFQAMRATAVATDSGKMPTESEICFVWEWVE